MGVRDGARNVERCPYSRMNPPVKSLSGSPMIEKRAARFSESFGKIKRIRDCL
jgi:hypothetical protein